ncbi:MAG: hypothetical protein EXR98_24010 [Gemmataceae bacterium]|nr:hypothetical protein [Gemmataceae bacterium]
MIFVREVSDSLTSLVKKMDETVNAASPKYTNGRRLGTFVIIGDAEGRVEQLRGMAQSYGLQRVNLCVGAAPPRYQVAEEADVTVVIYIPGRPGQNRVAANFALRRGELDGVKCDEIIAALANVLPK